MSVTIYVFFERKKFQLYMIIFFLKVKEDLKTKSLPIICDFLDFFFQWYSWFTPFSNDIFGLILEKYKVYQTFNTKSIML